MTVSLSLLLGDARSKCLAVMLGPEAILWPSGVRGERPSGFRDDLPGPSGSAPAAP